MHGVGMAVGNLQRERSTFVDRRGELRRVRELLGRKQLVTLIGTGGVGKTRLALCVACEVGRTFPDGVWLVELAEVRDPQLLAQVVAVTLGLTDLSSNPPLDSLARFVAGRQLLIILDNCEHLLGASAVLADRLLGSAERVRVLATSREPLGITGESIVLVRPLSVPARTRPISTQDIVTSDAVQLFLERAAEAAPDFVPAESDHHTVARLCQRLDGIPLALELAAVRLRSLSAEEILEGLDDRFGLLTSGSPLGLPRQRTLRAAIDWSYELCSPSEQLLWARMSVFAGSFDRAAAEQVCCGDGITPNDIDDLIAALVDKSVLARESCDGRARYRLLETIRQYGAELLALSGEEDALGVRHRDYYLHLAQQAQADWFSPRQLEWIRRLRDENANLRVAVDFSLTRPDEAEQGLAMATALATFWIATNMQDGRRYLRRALDEVPAPSVMRARAMCAYGFMIEVLSDRIGGEAEIQEYQTLAKQVGDLSTIAHGAQYAGVAAVHRGDYDVGVPLLEEALAGHRAVGDPNAVVMTECMLVQTLSSRGNLSRAAELANDALMLSETHGAEWSRSWALWARGLVAWHSSHRREAISQIREGIRVKYAYDLLGIALGVEALAWIQADGESTQDAARLLGVAQTVWQHLGSPLIRFGHFQELHDRCETAVRAALGEKRFRAAADRGAELDFEQAIADVAGQPRHDTTPAAPAPTTEPARLTPRERDVAELIAEGLTNPQIAARLVITPRTVAAHIEHIMDKYGVRSRTQIPALIPRHKP